MCRFPNQITNLINGKVALTRIQKYMQVRKNDRHHELSQPVLQCRLRHTHACTRHCVYVKLAPACQSCGALAACTSTHPMHACAEAPAQPA